jgi:phosphorylated adapter RNA export protein
VEELGEVKILPRHQIKKIVRVLGSERALALLAEAQSIEVSGGMMCLDGSRRRTPGGVFFFLCKQKHPDLFPQRSWKETRARKKQKKLQSNPIQGKKQ